MSETPPAGAVTQLSRAREVAWRHWGRAWQPTSLAIAPGRIELLGNHLDYNGGKVLAGAIDRYVTAEYREDGRHRTDVVFVDQDADKVVSVHHNEAADWRNTTPGSSASDYLRGAIAAGIRAGAQIAGGTLAVAGNVPIGFGLSSSAALCVALCLILHRPRPSGTDLVLRAQEAEHRAGTPCGTMDQSASVAGGVILFDGVSLKAQRINPDLKDHVFLVVDSGVSRSLAQSSYGLRVAECRRAVEWINRQSSRAVVHLAECDAAVLAELESRTHDTIDPILAARMRHVVTEMERVEAGRQAIERGDWPMFGQLMSASGQSSALSYDISHPRVEELVADLAKMDGVLGARMMGGGEGGSALALAGADAVAEITEGLRTGYFRRHCMATVEESVQTVAFTLGATVIEPEAGSISP